MGYTLAVFAVQASVPQKIVLDFEPARIL